MASLSKIDVENNVEGFSVSTQEGSFLITLIDNDIFMRPSFSIDNSNTFNINTENEDIYNIFEEVYNAIKNRKPYENSIYDFAEKDYVLPEYVDVEEEQKLFINNKVQWHSDDYRYSESSIFIMEKEEDCYKISFIESAATESFFPTHTVKFSLVSDRYHHFSQTFRNMYQKLDGYYYSNLNKKSYQRIRKI